MQAIAKRDFFYVSPAGEKAAVSVKVGKPYRVGTGTYACPVVLNGLYPRLADIRGNDSLQALGLAFRFVKGLLEGAARKGGKFYLSEGGEEISVNTWLP